jgi:hypothetical protein
MLRNEVGNISVAVSYVIEVKPCIHRARRDGAGGRGLPADPTIPRTHRGANPSRVAKHLNRIAVDHIRLTAGNLPGRDRCAGL